VTDDKFHDSVNDTGDHQTRYMRDITYSALRRTPYYELQRQSVVRLVLTLWINRLMTNTSKVSP